jgi:hypothetical protein
VVKISPEWVTGPGHYLKITGILNNVFRQQKALKKTRIKLYYTQ